MGIGHIALRGIGERLFDEPVPRNLVNAGLRSTGECNRRDET
jgi:hypothetical protein